MPSTAHPGFNRNLKTADPALATFIDKEALRQETGLELIASENYVSRAVLEAQGSILTNKYAEGYPGKRYYGGCEYVDEAEKLALERICKLYGCEAANVQPHSGSQANMAVFLALMNPGDRLLGMSLSHGGHLTHGSPVNFSGKLFQVTSYGLHPETHRLDYDSIREQALREKPKVIVAGASAYPRIIDFAVFGQIAREVGAELVVVEGPAFAATYGSAHDRSGLWWLVIDRLIHNDIPVAIVPPNNLKMYATGKGNAGKDDVLSNVIKRFPMFSVNGNDQADALVLMAMGLDHLGWPLVVLPDQHRRALEKAAWPV